MLPFRNRFWVRLVLSIPVLLYSPALQAWLDFSMPAFPGSRWLAPLFAIIIFVYGGLPFLQMAGPELKNRQPGMMTLISLAIKIKAPPIKLHNPLQKLHTILKRTSQSSAKIRLWNNTYKFTLFSDEEITHE